MKKPADAEDCRPAGIVIVRGEWTMDEKIVGVRR